MASNQKFKAVIIGIDGSITTVGALPAASVDYRDALARINAGAGVYDQVLVCLKADDDSYSWEDIQTRLSPTEKTWAFRSRGAGAGTFYWGGFYDFGATDNDFNPAITFGTIDIAYGAHFFIVSALHPGGGDTTIQVSGTSITDNGVRVAADTEDMVVPSGEPADSYIETVKKWIGRVTITKTAGPDVLCNYGFTKYWDNNNTGFKVLGLEATWLAAANDANFDILLRHHRATGWTYNNAAPPTPSAPIASLQGDYVTEYEASNGEQGAWKRVNLSVDIDGSGEEGTIIEVVTGAASTIELGNFLLRIRGA